MNDGECEVGRCQVCGKENVELQRTTYYYDIPCECHGPVHMILIRHCSNCTPQEPMYSKVEFKTEDLKNPYKLAQKIIDFADEQKNKRLKESGYAEYSDEEKETGDIKFRDKEISDSKNENSDRLKRGMIVSHYKRDTIEDTKNSSMYLYKILAFAKNTETNEDTVVYQALYGNMQVFVRPKDMFMEKLSDEFKVYNPQIKHTYRFEQFEEDK